MQRRVANNTGISSCKSFMFDVSVVISCWHMSDISFALLSDGCNRPHTSVAADNEFRNKRHSC